MTPEELAEEMQAEVVSAAHAALTLYEASEGECAPTETDRLLFEVGVQAGYSATLEMLVRRGLLSREEKR